MADIKTQDVVKGTVKTLDKAAIAEERIREAYIRTKDNAGQSVSAAGGSPEEYAADHFSGSTETAIYAVARQFDKQGRKAIKATKDNISTARERKQQRKVDQPKEQTQAARESAGVVPSSAPAPRASAFANPADPLWLPAKTAYGEPTATTRSTGRATLKTARGTVRTTQKSIKTAGQTSKVAIKTTEQAAKTAQKTAQATVKASQRAAQAAEATAKAVATGVKAAAKATAAAVKAVIAETKALISVIVAGSWIAVAVIAVVCVIGLIAGSCFGIFFSGEDSGTGQAMQTVVREINEDYEARIDAIKANISYDILEMSGSRAVWPEVLSVYAVKTATDPNGAQEVATVDDSKKAILKDIFWQMNEISSRTETKTETVIQESDDGQGNIIETEVVVTQTYLYITVGHKSAEEMANQYHFSAGQRKQLTELLAEENRSLWNQVLFGIGGGDGEIVTVALSQLGNVGGEPYWSWYGFSSRVEWCACFVSWCANECGYIGAGGVPKFAAVGTGEEWFKARGLWRDNQYTPNPGDIIFFDWESDGLDGKPDHVGIVEKVENGKIYTIEGNSNDVCKENRYTLGYYEVLGFGILQS